MGEILLFEGYDGSGKTTLVENFVKYLSSKGLSALVIGRDYNKIISNITFAIKDKDTEILPATEILLRFAREIERLKIIKENKTKYDFIILDRSILSATSWIYYYQEDWKIYSNMIEKIINQLGITKLIYCFLPFDTSWSRVTARGSLSKKELRGEDINHNMYVALRKTFLDFNYPTITKVEIDTNQSREDNLKNLIDALSI